MLGECQLVAAFCGAIGEGDAAIGVRDHVFAATEINVTPAGRDLLFKLGIAPAVDTDVDPRAMAVGDALAQPGVLFQAMHLVVIRTVDVLVTQLQVARRTAIRARKALGVGTRVSARVVSGGSRTS